MYDFILTSLKLCYKECHFYPFFTRHLYNMYLSNNVYNTRNSCLSLGKKTIIKLHTYTDKKFSENQIININVDPLRHRHGAHLKITF